MKTNYAIIARSKSLRTLMSLPEFSQEFVTGSVDRSGRLPETVYNLRLDYLDDQIEAKRVLKKLPKVGKVEYFIKTITEE